MSIKAFSFIFLLFCFISGVSQEIDPVYKFSVDSLVKATDKNKTFYEGTKEGEIYLGDKIIGSYTTHPLLDKANDKLYRLRYVEEGPDTNAVILFYYWENELVYATIKKKVRRGKKTIENAHYYFRNKKFLMADGKNSKPEEGQKFVEQADLAQREFYQTWFKEEKP